MRRILLWTLLAVALGGGAAQAALAAPYVVYTANSRTTGAVILRFEPATGTLVEISRNGAQGGLFQNPYDLAVEPDGSLVVADMGTLCTSETPAPCPRDGRVIRVDPLTGRQTLVASGGELVDTAGIAVARNGDLYVVDNLAADDDGGVIRIDPRTGAQTLVSRGGSLDLPFGIAIDRDGSLLVTNRGAPGLLCLLGGGSVIRVDPATGARSPVANGNLFSFPLGIALDAEGRIVVANECGAAGLVRLTLSLLPQLLTPNGDGDVLVSPERIALAPSGELLVSDFALGDGDGGIVSVTADGRQALLRRDDLFNGPLGIAAVVNHPPSAALSLAPDAVAAGRAVQLDGSGSADPEGQRLVYEWDLDGDGTFEASSGATPTATHAFTRDGTATVRVRVNDPHGARAVAEARALVDGSMPMLTRLRVRARVLGVGPRPRKRADRRRRGARRPPPRSTTLRFHLSEPATAMVRMERARAGRRGRDGRCRPGRRRGRRCLSWSLTRRISHAASAGENAIPVRARGLRPGRFRLVTEASDRVGNRSARRAVSLRIVRLRR